MLLYRKRGLPKLERRKAIRYRPMKIRQGNGASVVVWAGESPVHGEGKQLIILMQITENVRDIMRSPEYVLNILTEHSQCFELQDLERLLPYFFQWANVLVTLISAYMLNRAIWHQVHGWKTIEPDQCPDRIDTPYCKSQRWELPAPSCKADVYSKEERKMRPFRVPSFKDKLVQEVVRMILEAIYERYFEYSSHGFRPSKSCHTALSDIQKTFSGVKWFVEGDIKRDFSTISIMTILR